MLKYLFIGLPNILTISRPKRTIDLSKVSTTGRKNNADTNIPTALVLFFMVILNFRRFFFFTIQSITIKINVYLQKVSINVEHVLKNTNFLFLSFVMDN